MDALTMSRTTVVLAILVNAAFSVVSAQTPPTDAAPRVESPGDSPARTEAIRRYQSLLNNDSPALSTSRDEIMFRLGLLYLEDAQAAGPGAGGYGNRAGYEQALSLFQQVLAKPGSIFREEALYYQAIAFEETGRSEQALNAFHTIVRDYPSTARASELYFRLGNDAVRKNRIAEAGNDYQEVLRRGDARYRDQSAYMYAWCAFALRQNANARVTLLDLLSRMEAAGQQKGDLYNESVELLAKVVRAEGSTAALSGPWVGPRPAFAPLVLRRAADLYRETSGFREAAMAYEQLQRDYPDPAAADQLDKLAMECHLKAGDAPRAEEARERLVSRHISGGKLDAATAAEVAPLLKDSALYLHSRARETKQQDLYKRAIQAYQVYADTVSEGQAHWEAVFLQAEALKEYGDWTSAAERYKAIAEAHDAKHGEESAFRRIALLEDAKTRGQSDVARVLASYEDYFKTYPGGPHEVELRNRQAGYLFDEKRYADALVAGGSVVSRVSAPADRQRLQLMLARAAYEAGDYNQSANWVGRLLTEPGLPPATKTEADQIRSAAILKSAESLKDRPLEAAGQYELLARAYPQHPSAPAALYNAAILYRDHGDPTRAVGLLRSIVDGYPKSDLARDATAAADELYKKSGDAAGAANFLASAAKAGGNTPESSNLLYEAATRARNGNYTSQAVDFYEKFLSMRPPNDLRAATARIYLAKQYARQGRDGEAERLARETMSTTSLSGTPQDIQQAQLVLAEARLIVGDASLRRFESIRLAEPLAASLKKKQQAMEVALEELRGAAAYGFADVSLASYTKIGYAQLDFANAVMQAPRPRTLSADQRQQYDAALREQMRPYREAAEKAFRLTLEQAKSAGIENEWTSRARGALSQSGVAAPAAAAVVAPVSQPMAPPPPPAPVPAVQPQPAAAPAQAIPAQPVMVQPVAAPVHPVAPQPAVAPMKPSQPAIPPDPRQEPPILVPPPTS
jgi:Tetratricopeptide repeat